MLLKGPDFAARIVRCPTCGGESVYAPSNPARPFCSPRCKKNDFGAWASEAYRVEPPETSENAQEPEGHD
ncbi:MAG: DNA gyrase inhibitor YacG [Pseudomonadota bacterium]|nr:DNA gyrase inhibitor YacG [Pseudomonadota bacterium]